eukprot:8928388-Alexandrium_andersonii.AAC.1
MCIRDRTTARRAWSGRQSSGGNGENGGCRQPPGARGRTGANNQRQRLSGARGDGRANGAHRRVATSERAAEPRTGVGLARVSSSSAGSVPGS